MLRTTLVKILTGAAVTAALIVPAAGPASANLPGTEGCSPGYWKTHPASWVGSSPTTTVGSVWSGASAFPTLADDTLMDALGYGGGPGTLGGAQILLHQATAALLNSTSGIDFPAGDGPINRTNTALQSGSRAEMISLAALFDAKNNLGCPLN